MLKTTVESEMRLIPYKKIFIRTNDDAILHLSFLGEKPQCKRIECIEKYVDCWNCIVESLKDALEDPMVCDDDIILFKHETVFLNDLGLFKRAISQLLSGFNMITRIFWGGSTSDIFLVKVSAIRDLIHSFSSLPEIPYDQYVESMFHQQIVEKISLVYAVSLGSAPFTPNNVSSWGSNALGFYHLHNYHKYSISRQIAVDLFAQEFWKKSDYFTLYEQNNDICRHKYYPSFSNYYVDFMKFRPDLDTSTLQNF